jgi:hypothetical protein
MTAAFVTAFIACPVRYLGLGRWITPRHIYPVWWMPPILIAIEYVGIVSVAALSGAVASYGPRLQFGNFEMRRNTVRATAIAIWTAPLMVLLLQRSALTGVVAAGIVIFACNMLGVGAKEGLEPTIISRQSGPGIFQVTNTLGFAKRLALAILVSAFLQAAAVANVIAERELALLLFVIGAALLAMKLPALEGEPDRPRLASHAGSRAFASMTMATLVALIGLLPLLSGGSRDHSLDAVLRKLWQRTGSGAVVHRSTVRLQEASVRSDGYIGVILIPKQEHREKQIVAPQLSLSSRAAGLLRPLTIRFTGSYWFFQYPFVRPPFDSVKAEGDPANVGVRSSNYKPLMMEAVQTLDDPIDTAGLGKIQLSMLDADPYPGTVSVELVLVDTTSWDHPLQSLGIQHLNTIPVAENASSSHSETLTFAVAQDSQSKQFNQIRLIFRLDPSRNRQGAAIAIQSFVLVPGP